mmetsp:Transcript_2647/g.6840  ORF Transcript_2647/g.6840 Transcript_2647/m.6840 type:complete len:205 (+) Transcript_2647:1930-2544(+)
MHMPCPWQSSAHRGMSQISPIHAASHMQTWRPSSVVLQVPCPVQFASHKDDDVLCAFDALLSSPACSRGLWAAAGEASQVLLDTIASSWSGSSCICFCTNAFCKTTGGARGVCATCNRRCGAASAATESCDLPAATKRRRSAAEPASCTAWRTASRADSIAGSPPTLPVLASRPLPAWPTTPDDLRLLFAVARTGAATEQSWPL